MDPNISLREMVLEKHDHTLIELETIWDKFGLLDDQRRDRREAFHTHILNLCKRVLDDEKALMERINNRIMGNTQNILQICEELGMTPEDEVDGLGLLDLDALLRERLEKLEQMKEERIEQLKELQEKDEGLCELLCEIPYYIPPNLVPTHEDMQSIEAHIKSMEAEKEEREKMFSVLKAGVMEFLEELEQSPEDSFLQRLICLDEDEDVPLGKADLQQLRTVHSDLEFKIRENEAKSLELRESIRQFWDLLQIPVEEREAFFATAPRHTPSSIAKLEEEMRRLRVLRQQNISSFIEKLEVELSSWWDKCFVGDEDRERFTATHPGAEEEVLDAYELEVKKWKSFYNNNQGIIDMINTFLGLFTQMCELEEKAKDPSRLFNTRGGALLLEEKAKKKVKTELPRVECRLIEMGKEWESTSGRPFCIYGMSIEEHIQGLWEKHDARREEEKNKKLQEKGTHDTKQRGFKGTAVAKTPIASQKRTLTCDEPMSAKRPKHQAYLAPPTSPAKNGRSVSPVKGMSTPRCRPLAERNFQAPMVPAPKPTEESRKPTEELHSTVSYDNFKDRLKSSSECLNSTTLEQAISDCAKL